MQKPASYHRSAVIYNEALAEAAEGLSEKLEDPEIQKWARSVGKQHRFHLKRHKLALEKIEAGEEVDEEPDSVQHRDAETGQYVSEEYANEHPSTTVQESDEVQA